MKVDRDLIHNFIWNIRNKYKNQDIIDISDEILAEELCKQMETTPSCVNIDEKSIKGRYYYSTVGYGVFSLLGEYYRMGRVEIFDKDDESGYAINEGSYCMPFLAAHQFEDFIEGIETDLPISIQMGSVQECSYEVSKLIDIPVDKLNDLETKKNFYKEKYKHIDKNDELLGKIK